MGYEGNMTFSQHSMKLKPSFDTNIRLVCGSTSLFWFSQNTLVLKLSSVCLPTILGIYVFLFCSGWCSSLKGILFLFCCFLMSVLHADKCVFWGKSMWASLLGKMPFS